MNEVGYARVSTREQNPKAQEAELRAAGASRVFVDRGESSRVGFARSIGSRPRAPPATLTTACAPPVASTCSRSAVTLAGSVTSTSSTSQPVSAASSARRSARRATPSTCHPVDELADRRRPDARRSTGHNCAWSHAPIVLDCRSRPAPIPMVEKRRIALVRGSGSSRLGEQSNTGH